MWSHFVWQLVLRRLSDLSDICFFERGLAFIVLLNLNLAGTTLAALSRASNVMTQAATTMKPETGNRHWENTAEIRRQCCLSS
jgi:hypothetical protein